MSAVPRVGRSVSNVLVIGSGAAGLRVAIAARQAGVEVLVVGKRLRGDAHTVLAAGGINAVLGTRDPNDTWQQHFADTLKEGRFLADPRVVELLVREAPQAVLELAEWGCPFARTEDGRIDQRFFGAHKYRRTCYAGDFTGRVVISTLLGRSDALGIPIVENQYVSRLLVRDGVCFGAFAFDLNSGARTVFLADAVILAAGGHTRLWRRSSSRRGENTGDGMLLALRAGCRLADMELVQFHPTGMVWPEEVAGMLVTEAVRGEGGRLFNAQGERFMERYDPDRLELSARDRVALANYREIQEGRGGPHGGVFLDISHRGKEYILEKLPRMYRQFLEHQGIDISQEPMEVAPTAHYTMGGVVVNPETHATDVQGLYAAGEVTTGLHGANRLGGNSLAETVVFGRRAGEAAAAFSLSRDVQLRSRREIEQAAAELDAQVRPGRHRPETLAARLRELMWEQCGVVRTEEGLNRGLADLEQLQQSAADLDVSPESEGYDDLGRALDLRASLCAAEATLRAALERRETRGAHIRDDHPEQDESFRRNLLVALEEDRLVLSDRPVPPVPDHLREWAAETGEIDAEGRLLE